MKSHSEHLKQLGEVSDLPSDPESAILEVIPCDLMGQHSTCAVRFTVPEFTSLCPKTGQPDFAIIVIDYVPDKLLVESKALKLFMGSFRNHGAFHEDVSAYIGKRLAYALSPYWLRVASYWYPRGGIPIDVLWEYGSQLIQPIPDNGWLKQKFVQALPLPNYNFRGR